jgi:hypothetical protein
MFKKQLFWGKYMCVGRHTQESLLKPFSDIKMGAHDLQIAIG